MDTDGPTNSGVGLQAPELPKEVITGGALCAHDRTKECPVSKEVVTTRYLFSALGGLLAALLAAAAAWGSFVYAQAADAGRSGAEAAARVNTRVDELAKVVADNQRAQARATAEIQSDIRALSLQMVTGRQPASLMMPASADGGGGP